MPKAAPLLSDFLVTVGIVVPLSSIYKPLRALLLHANLATRYVIAKA